MLAVGDVAPDFSLPDSDGTLVKLSSFRDKKVVVLYFYPKDDTPGCTAESCSFRDSYEDFVTAGAEVIGVSSDSSESHKKFANKHNLPFVLVSDSAGKVQKQFGIRSLFGLMPGRVTFVIDRSGVIRHVFDSQLQATKHVREAIGVVKQLQG
jgi:peroxiredoxin Q/BCP